MSFICANIIVSFSLNLLSTQFITVYYILAHFTNG